MKRILIVGTCLLFFGCNNIHKTNEDLLSEKKDSLSTRNEKIPHKIIGNIIQSIPSHIETSNLIKESGGIYNIGLLNTTDLTKKTYHSNFDKALNIGVYGTDLGYVSIYGQNKDAIAYMDCIQHLAKELSIGQFFHYETFKRLAMNQNNMDSILFLTVNNFEKINTYLYEQKRSEQSVLILTGGWLEAIHISCQVVKQNTNKRLKEKIGEQKIVLDQLITLVENYDDDDENMRQLSKLLIDLQKIYETIKVTKSYKESKMEEINGVYVLNDKSESAVFVTDAQIEEIDKVIQSIREKFVI